MCYCGPRPGEAALAPPSQVWVRFNSNEPTTLNTLIQYMWWPWVCRERNAHSPVDKNARATVSGTVLCRLDVLDMYLIKHLTRGFLQILIIRDVMNFWNFEVWDFSEMPFWIIYASRLWTVLSREAYYTKIVYHTYSIPKLQSHINWFSLMTCVCTSFHNVLLHYFLRGTQAMFASVSHQHI